MCIVDEESRKRRSNTLRGTTENRYKKPLTVTLYSIFHEKTTLYAFLVNVAFIQI